jgi:hypothetical protein
MPEEKIEQAQAKELNVFEKHLAVWVIFAL